MLIKVAVLPGDGIGPEVTDQAVRVLETVANAFGHELSCTRKDIGGAALKSSKDPLPNDTLQACLSSGAVLLGAVGGPSFDGFPSHLRPESGLLRLRRELGVFANLRPATCFPSLEDCSPLRADVVKGTDLLIVRELLGGIYYGEPRLIQGPTGDRTATDTMRYTEKEIERVSHVAFELARSRRRNLVSVDKANVLDCSRLWRDVVTRISQDYVDVKTSHMYVDSAAMALVSGPADFDVVLTENMFGDILSDQAASVVGSLGMLGSASLGGPVALYEPIHGSAPDIAGQGIANPIGAILSAAMMLRYSFNLKREASCVESAVASVLAAGNRTKDLARGGHGWLSTQHIGAVVTEAVRATSNRNANIAS
ncbi:MAG: 3-isopropylmalate dehydrogenase [Terriglobales bacterium]